MPSLSYFMFRKKDPVRLVLQGYNLHASGTKEECLARLVDHMQRHPDAQLDEASPELELAAQHLRRWYSKGTGLSINSTWFLGGKRLRPWQQGTEIHHQGTMRQSMYRRSQRPVPLLAVHAEDPVDDDHTLSGDDVPMPEDPTSTNFPSPRARWSATNAPETPRTPRTPGGLIARLDRSARGDRGFGDV